MKDPLLALGLRALTVAMKAKGGQLRDVDLRAFLRDVLRHAHDRPEWRDAALAFEAASHADAAEAGEALHDWLIECVPAFRDRVVQIGTTLAEVEAQHHAWMDRADING